jgi:hypothetical protein
VTKKHPRGRPQFKPTKADRATVSNLAALGATHEEIARCVGTEGIDDDTLRKHFKAELETSLGKVKAMAMTSVVAAIGRGEAWATCFFLKCRAGWRETQTHEHSGPGGTTIDVNVSGRDILAARIAGIASRSAAVTDHREPDRSAG